MRNIQKIAVIKKEDGKYKLYTRDGKKVLGTHDDKQDAIKQEYAIEKSKEQKAAMTAVKTTSPVRLENGRYKGKRYGYTLEVNGKHYKTEEGVRNTREHAGTESFLVLDGKIFKLDDNQTQKTAQMHTIIRITRTMITGGPQPPGQEKEENADNEEDSDKDPEGPVECPGGGMLKTVPLEVLDDEGNSICKDLEAEVADTDEDKEKGLSERDELPEGCCMFFSTPGPFWMKNTKIPLDVAFLSKEGRVVDVQTMEPYPGAPDFLLPRYYPKKGEAVAALELPARFCSRKGIKEGAVVRVRGGS